MMSRIRELREEVTRPELLDSIKEMKFEIRRYEDRYDVVSLEQLAQQLDADETEGWDDLTDLYSTVTQAAVMRIEDSIKALSQLKQNGYNVGSLNWKAPSEFRSFTYVQSGFEFDKKNGQTVLSLAKLADIPISYHRKIPEDVTVKEVCIKKERSSEWYASFAVEGKEEPPKPDNPDRCIGIDVGILKYAHDTDGRAVGSLPARRTRATQARTTVALTETTRLEQLGAAAVESSRMPPASQAETPRLPAQTLELLRHRV